MTDDQDDQSTGSGRLIEGDNNSNLILREDRDRVATLTLNRPENRNALSLTMLHALGQRLKALEIDENIRVVVIAGYGPAFSAGHDLTELSNASEKEAQEIFATCSAVMSQIATFPRPVIAMVGGVATAAGCQLVASADLAVAGRSARFATPGVNIGLFCSTPAVPLIRTVAPKHAMEMLLTGELISADDAYRMGLVNRVVPGDELGAATYELAELLASKPPAVITAGKAALRRQMTMPLDSAYDLTSAAMCEGLGMADAREGISAFLERRSPIWS